MLNEINAKDNLQSPSTNAQPQIIQNNDNQNQPIQILSNQPVVYQIYPNQPVQYQLVSLNNQPVQYQVLPPQQNQYYILPNLNSQIQYTPQIAYENIYNPPVSDPFLNKLNECEKINIQNDYNYCCGREEYKVTGITIDSREINLFKIIESSESSDKCLNSKFSKPMNLKFYAFEDNQLLNPLIEIKEGSCYVCGCICQDVCMGINDIEIKVSNDQLTRIIKREKKIFNVERKIYDINGNLLYSIQPENCKCRIILIFIMIILSVIFLFIALILLMLSGGAASGGGCDCCNCSYKIKSIFDNNNNYVGSITTFHKCCCCDCNSFCCCYKPLYVIEFKYSMDIHSKLSLIGATIEMDYTNI